MELPWGRGGEGVRGEGEVRHSRCGWAVVGATQRHAERAPTRRTGLQRRLHPRRGGGPGQG